MCGTRDDSVRARTAIAALANLLIFGLAGCGEIPPREDSARGRGPLVSRYDDITACEQTAYEGANTLLYSNRPYHTESAVAGARGLSFCRGARHGTNIWTIEVIRPTTLVVFGQRGDGLDSRGWTPSKDPLEVAAAGVALNQVYTRPFPVGRYVIRQGFTRTAPIVLFDPAAARVLR